MSEGDESSVQGAKVSVAGDRVAVVVNGHAKQVTGDLIDTLDQIVQSGDLFVSRSLEEGREIAATIVNRGYPTVLTGGGDGTFVQMVSAIVVAAREKGVPSPRFGLLKLGTGNALAWVLGAQNPRHRGVIADLGRLRQEGGSRELRLLEIEGLLTPFAGCGADAVALHHYNATKESLGKSRWLKPLAGGGVAYFLSIAGRTMPSYLARPKRHVRILNAGEPAARLDGEGQPMGAEVPKGGVLYEGSSNIVAMSTIPYWGFGVRVFPFADDRDDRFHLRVVNSSPIEVALNIREIWRGTYRSDTFSDFLVEDIEIRYEEPMALQIGGDPVGERTTIRATLAKEPIRVVDYYAPPMV